MPVQKRILLLDLEETIPQWGDWFVPDFYALPIRQYLKNFRPHNVEIFSWAIYNQSDIDTFNIYRDNIAIEVGTPFHHVHDIASLIEQYRKTTGIHILDQKDFFDFVSKERFLFDMALKGYYADKHVVLLDDAVKAYSLSLKQYNCQIDVINIKDEHARQESQ